MDPEVPVTGWMIDFADILAEKLGVCYELVRQLHPGVRLDNGTYTLVTGLLQRSEIDLVITPWIMSPAREEIMDFSTYIYIEQQELIATRPKPEADITGFIKPFPAYAGQINAAILLRYSYMLNPPELYVRFIYSLTVPAVPWEPKRVPERILTCVWLIFTLIICTLYRSNLKAMLISPKIVLPFTNLEEFLSTGMKVHLFEGSVAWDSVMKAPPDSLLGRLLGPAIIDGDGIAAIAKMFRGELVGLSSQATHKNLMHLDFTKNGECTLFATYNDAMLQLPVGIPFPTGSKLIPKVNDVVTRLREFGILDHLYKRHVPNASECFKPVSATLSVDALRPLELKDFYGVFSIYVGGLLLGLLAFGCELLIKHQDDSRLPIANQRPQPSRTETFSDQQLKWRAQITKSE
ncbi:hypothetical protein SK128_007353 [Halocaridina rubra]|uniref:Ionotropic glutamate receptor C-terminal domain-containing protein n=1 Tax=Halocaridina rubra TaxID=373956 RepID=A0AAN8WP31_HALRR